MLIVTDRHRDDDLDTWRRCEEIDRLRWMMQGAHIERRARRAIVDIQEFASTHEGYVGVSWGKDSVLVAHLCIRAEIGWPLVHIKVEGLANPDTDPVRDAFLDRFDVVYHELECDQLHRGGTSLLDNPQTDGFTLAQERFGRDYISGVRADEAGYRRLRMAKWGVSSKHACAPAGWWTHEEVFAYLFGHDLPVHPAYAYSMGGTYERTRLRTAAIGGERGRNQGRLVWERVYYPEIVHRLEAARGHQA